MHLRHTILFTLLLLSTICCAVPSVKVGYYPLHGYHDIDKEGVKSGYGYDFLQLIRRYNSLRYEYLGTDKTWEENLQMLRRGEIDLITGAHKTVEREKDFDFSLPIGTNAINISVRYNEKRYKAEQYNTYNGMVVGFVQGDVSYNRLKRHAQINHFNFTPRFYKNFSMLAPALERKEIDAVCESSLLKLENLRTLESFDNEYVYVMVKKGNTQLLNIINNSIEQLDNTEKDWSIRTYRQNYYDGLERVLYFTDKEKAFLKQLAQGKKKLVVATDNNWKPYSWYEDGQYKGIIIDFWKEIMKMAGIDCEFYVSDKDIIGTDVMDNPKVDMYLSSSDDKQESEDKGFIPSPIYFEASIALLQRKDVKVIRTLAQTSTTPTLNRFIDQSDSTTIKEYPNTDEAVKAVLNGEADGIYLYNYVAQLYTEETTATQLGISFQPGKKISLRMIVRDGTEPELMSVLSKCIYKFNQTDKHTIAAKYLYKQVREVSWTEFMMQHLWSTAFFLLTIILGFFLYKRKQDAKVSRQNELARKAAEEASAAKSRFLFNMSHDIRTPMNAIIGFTELLRKNQDNKIKSLDYINKISKSSNVLLSIINNVLEMARIENGKEQLEEKPYHVGTMTSTLYTVFEEMMKEKGITFTRTINVQHEFIYCDVAKLREILLNILSNAYKYTPAGGHVSVETTELPADKTGYITIRTIVSDNGIGMSEEYQKHLFEEFTREKNNTETKIEGTGLGMAIVKRYLDIMGGSIKVKSMEGIGTTFTIDNIHRIVTEEERPEEIIKDIDRENIVDNRILLAEDNELNAEIAVEILKEAGFNVDVAVDGVECLKMLEEASPLHYSLILMDIQMPRLDGYETTKKIRALDNPLKADIPIIAMTANAFKEDKDAAFKAGMNEHIAKPIDIDILLNTITQVLKKNVYKS